MIQTMRPLTPERVRLEAALNTPSSSFSLSPPTASNHVRHSASFLNERKKGPSDMSATSVAPGFNRS